MDAPSNKEFLSFVQQPYEPQPLPWNAMMDDSEFMTDVSSSDNAGGPPSKKRTPKKRSVDFSSPIGKPPRKMSISEKKKQLKSRRSSQDDEIQIVASSTGTPFRPRMHSNPEFMDPRHRFVPTHQTIPEDSMEFLRQEQLLMSVNPNTTEVPHGNINQNPILRSRKRSNPEYVDRRFGSSSVVTTGVNSDDDVIDLGNGHVQLPRDRLKGLYQKIIHKYKDFFEKEAIEDMTSALKKSHVSSEAGDMGGKSIVFTSNVIQGNSDPMYPHGHPHPSQQNYWGNNGMPIGNGSFNVRPAAYPEQQYYPMGSPQQQNQHHQHQSQHRQLPQNQPNNRLQHQNHQQLHQLQHHHQPINGGQTILYNQNMLSMYGQQANPYYSMQNQQGGSESTSHQTTVTANHQAPNYNRQAAHYSHPNVKYNNQMSFNHMIGKSMWDKLPSWSDVSLSSDANQSISDPFKSISDPFESTSDPFKSKSDPFQSTSDPFQSLSDQFQSISDPNRSNTFSDHNQTFTDNNRPSCGLKRSSCDFDKSNDVFNGSSAHNNHSVFANNEPSMQKPSEKKKKMSSISDEEKKNSTLWAMLNEVKGVDELALCVGGTKPLVNLSSTDIDLFEQNPDVGGPLVTDGMNIDLSMEGPFDL